MPEHTELLPDPLPAEPLAIVKEWLAQATAARTQPNPNSMVLATASRDGHPDARVVLCKDVIVSPGFIVFYTNYHSAKGRELAENPYAAGVMHWDALHRQVRLTGPVTLTPATDSDTYFATRPWQSRLGAWASQQSEPIDSRTRLLEAVRSMARRFRAPPPGSAGAPDSLAISIPRPPHWGGYRLWAQSVELWVEGEARVHDRARWTRPLTAAPEGGFSAGAWSATRLQP
jgi:pyridoxamine 5'-phosphate oxidase